MKYIGLFFKKIILTVFTLSCLINTALADNERVVIKLATLGQKGISSMIYLDDVFIPQIVQATEGEVIFDVYWGGVMGDEEDYIGKMRTGQLQGAMVSASGGITDAVCPDLSVLELPFLFNAWAWDEATYVIDQMKSYFSDTAELRGYKILLILTIDFDQIYSSKQNIETIEDMRSAKFLTWFGPLENKMLRSLGIFPIPVNVPEVVSSMKTGICDMAISPSLWWVGAQLYPDTKYVNPLPFRHVPGMIVINFDTWNKISEKSRVAMEFLFKNSQKELQKVIRDNNERAYKAMLKYGIKEVTVKSEEELRFKTATRVIWDELAGKSYSRESLDMVISLLKEYRENKQIIKQNKGECS